MPSYDLDSTTYSLVHCARVNDDDAFVKLLFSHLNEGCRFLTKKQASAARNQPGIINNALLGSISEFGFYILCGEIHRIKSPFIGSFRAADPFGKGNYPLVDVRMFLPKKDPADDRLCLVEIKATRDNPPYLKDSLHDFSGLYGKSRIYSTAEHLKADLKHAKRRHYVQRVNDCLGTCEADSPKISLYPAGACGAIERQCVDALSNVVQTLLKSGWRNVRGYFLLIPDMEATYLRFATGEGFE